MPASPVTTFLEALEERRGEGRAVTQVEPQTPPGTSRVDLEPSWVELGLSGTSQVDLLGLRKMQELVYLVLGHPNALES